MTDSLVFQLTDKGLVTDSLTLDIGLTGETVTKASITVLSTSITMTALFRRVPMAVHDWTTRPISAAN